MKRLLSILVLPALFLAAGFLGARGQQASTTAVAAPAKITVWCTLHNHPAATVKNYAETPLYQEIAKRLPHIKFEFWHTPNEARFEQFNLMIASRDLPDIIEWDFIDEYPGGAEKAIQDGVIVKHNDIIEKHAPNLRKIYKDHPEWLKEVKTDSGTLYNFPFIRGDKLLQVYYGLTIRKDWLDDLGLEVPTTIQEWETALRGFKGKGVQAPLTFVGSLRMDRSPKGSQPSANPFIGAYGISFDFHLDSKGKVLYGPVEPAFKSYLALFRKWYVEGLLDADLAANDRKAYEANLTSGKSGASVGYIGGTIGKLMDLIQKTDPRYVLVGTPFPTLKKGQVCEFGHLSPAYGGSGAAITTACKNVKVAAEFLDFGYSAAGHMLHNFGIEGESYTMVNGYPTYTEVIFNNAEGLSMSQAMGRFMRSNFDGPFVQDRRYIEQYYRRPEQTAALEIFAKTRQEAHQIPTVTFTPQESERYAAIMNEVDTYLEEMYYKFIMGQESLDRFDVFVNEMKKMGIEEAIAIQQAAVKRYNAR